MFTVVFASLHKQTECLHISCLAHIHPCQLQGCCTGKKLAGPVFKVCAHRRPEAALVYAQCFLDKKCLKRSENV